MGDTSLDTKQEDAEESRIGFITRTLMEGKYCVVYTRDLEPITSLLEERLGGTVHGIDRVNLGLAISEGIETPDFMKGYLLVASANGSVRSGDVSYMWLFDRGMIDDVDYDTEAAVGQIIDENNGVEAYQILAPRGEA
jgi:hypothetical protein